MGGALSPGKRRGRRGWRRSSERCQHPETTAGARTVLAGTPEGALPAVDRRARGESGGRDDRGRDSERWVGSIDSSPAREFYSGRGWRARCVVFLVGLGVRLAFSCNRAAVTAAASATVAVVVVVVVVQLLLLLQSLPLPFRLIVLRSPVGLRRTGIFVSVLLLHRTTLLCLSFRHITRKLHSSHNFLSAGTTWQSRLSRVRCRAWSSECSGCGLVVPAGDVYCYLSPSRSRSPSPSPRHARFDFFP